MHRMQTNSGGKRYLSFQLDVVSAVSPGNTSQSIPFEPFATTGCRFALLGQWQDDCRRPSLVI